MVAWRLTSCQPGTTAEPATAPPTDHICGAVSERCCTSPAARSITTVPKKTAITTYCSQKNCNNTVQPPAPSFLHPVHAMSTLLQHAVGATGTATACNCRTALTANVQLQLLKCSCNCCHSWGTGHRGITQQSFALELVVGIG